jgi:hypothetical protein
MGPEGLKRNDKGRFAHKLTPALSKSIIANVKSGLFDQQNALEHGVDITTLKSWIDRGLDEDANADGADAVALAPFREFAEGYIRESIALESHWIGTIMAAAEPGPGREYSEDGRPCAAPDRGDWKASAWLLERRFPLRWGITRQPDGGPREALKLPDAFLSRRRRIQELTEAPPPELVKAFRDAGYDIVRRVTPTESSP